MASRRPWGVIALTAVVVVATIVVLVWWVVARSEVTPWAEVTAEGTDLTVHYIGGECDRSASLDVDESSDEVIVTVRITGWALSCSDVGVPRVLHGTLEAPLGARPVVDGACLLPRYAQHLACSGG